MTLQERLRTMKRYSCHEAADALDAKDRALREIAEEWAGAECGEPVTAQEAYAIQIAKRMYTLAVEALK